MAEAALTAPHSHSGEGGSPPATPAPRQRDSQEGARLVWKHEPRPHLVAALRGPLLRAPSPALLRRGQTAPAAFRGDDDVGTRLAMLDTLRL
jgi:hypothetical protein